MQNASLFLGAKKIKTRCNKVICWSLGSSSPGGGPQTQERGSSAGRDLRSASQTSSPADFRREDTGGDLRSQNPCADPVTHASAPHTRAPGSSPALPPASGFLTMHTLGGSGNGASHFFCPLPGGPRPQPQLPALVLLKSDLHRQVGSEQAEVYSLCLSSK